MSIKTMLKNKRAQKGGAIGLAAAGALVAALAFAPASGAYFSASGAGTANVNTASLGLDFGSADAKTFNVTFDNVAPGDSVYKTFTVRNTGTIPADVSFHARDLQVTQGKPDNLALLSYHIEGYNPPSATATVDDTTFNLGRLNPGEARNYELYIKLDPAANDTWQNVKLLSNIDITLNQVR